MSRYIDADLIEYHEEYDGQGFARVAYADDIENLPTVELIDKGRLKFVIEKNFGHGTIEPILQLIDAQPTADVVEVVHGEWIMINEQLAKCSVCGGYESTNGKDNTGKGVIFKMQKKFCPHCGTDMRGGTE